MFKVLGKSLRGLHWKLTLSYTLVTVAAFVIVLIVTVAGMWLVLTNSNLATIALLSMTRSFIAPSALPYLESSQPDIQGLANWLEAASNPEGLSFRSPVYTNIEITIGGSGSDLALLVLDRNLEYLAGVPDMSTKAVNNILAESETLLAAALAGEVNPERITHLSTDRSLTLAVPVTSKNGDHLGLVVLRLANPPLLFFQQGLSILGKGLLTLTTTAGIIGAVFGFFTSRGLTRRLRRVTQTTDRWSQGDFSTFIQDRSEDEIGQLTQRLNRMAEQLQNLLQTRQELAVLEERNRLARDLHDGVKQQVFATAMQIGAARELIEQDANAARKHLDQAERLALKAQKELAAIIRELYPATLENKGLAPAIQELVDDWSRINKIRVETNITDQGRLPKEIEQTLFRVTQEALSNITKHSQATRVVVELKFGRQDVAVMISDNGRGFDIDTDHNRGIGLRNMRERIESIGGDFHLESTPGSGTCLRAGCQISKGATQ